MLTLAVIAALLLASGIIVAERLHARPPLAVVRPEVLLDVVLPAMAS